MGSGDQAAPVARLSGQDRAPTDLWVEANSGRHLSQHTRQNGGVLLRPETERIDLLRVLAANRREVRIRLETDEPLRKPRPQQAERVRAQSEAARADLVAQLRDAGRRPFRGRVAVRLDLAIPESYADLGLRRMVKEYVDVLKGHVFADDAAVDHLEVHRSSVKHGRASAELRCLPLAAFCDDFDRAFRVWDEIRAAVPDRGWGRPFDEHDQWLLRYDEGVLDLIADLDAQEDEQLAEDPDGFVDLDVPSGFREFEDWEVRASARKHLAESVACARGVWLCDQGLDSRDRPGDAPAWHAEAHELDVADVVMLPDVGPGCFLLPAPPIRGRKVGEPPWASRVQSEVAGQLRREGMAAVRFGGPVALDIAFRGGSADHTDIDNRAHDILTAFEAALWRAAPEVGGYRAYRQDGPAPAVRVRLMPHARLLAFGSALERARGVVRTESRSRVRAAR